MNLTAPEFLTKHNNKQINFEGDKQSTCLPKFQKVVDKRAYSIS